MKPRTYLALISAFLWGLSYPLTKMNQTAFAVSGAGKFLGDGGTDAAGGSRDQNVAHIGLLM